jgi:RNA polymerase sigma-70 factor (ECF subfamily)
MSTSISAGLDVESWYTVYGARLRRAARRVTGNADDAEDALQDAFVAALRSYGRYNGGDPYPWLHRIAVRKALNIIGRRRPGAGELPPPPVEPSAEVQALAHLGASELAGLLRGEPAVALHLLGGLRFHEVADRMGTPAATAATRIRRGKQRLRAQLEATFADLPVSRPA